MAVKVLYFLAGMVATANELAGIARLSADPHNNVQVRNGLVPDVYGSAETCDAVAAYAYPTGVPTDLQALVTAATVANYSAEALGGPNAMLVIAPGGSTFAHTATKQLAVAAQDPTTGVLSDITTAAGTTYASDATGVATVNSTGLVTGVAAGTAHITVTSTTNGGTTSKSITLTLT